MAKRISKAELGIDDNLLSSLNEQLNEAIRNTKRYEEAQRNLTAINKVAISGAKDYVKLLKEQNLATVEGQKEYAQKAKEANRLILDEEKIKQSQLRTSKLIEQSKQAELRTQKMINTEKAKTLTAYQKESKALNENREKWKSLAVQQKQNTKEGRDLLRLIKQQDDNLKKIDSTVGQNQRSVGNYSKAIGGLKSGLSQLGLAFGAFQLIRSAGSTIIDFEENAANMAKTLGVSTSEAKKLAKELLSIDTRTSVEELQKIATIGGQLGIGANEIIGFTKAVDTLNVALGDEFTGGAEEITTVIGGLRNVLTDIKTDDVSADLLSIGNAINILGANGNATAPVVSDFANRIAGIAIPLGVSTDKILGLSATLQELGVNQERGGTAVGKILQEMAKNVGGFAEIAGVDVTKFGKLVNEDIFEAFKKVLEGSKKFKGDNVALTKSLDSLGLSGSGASEVFLKLSGNMELLDKKNTLVADGLKSTTSLTDEFNAKNNTLGASIEKLGKEFQKYIIGIDEAGNVSGKLGSVINFLVHNFETIVNVIGKATVGFLSFKAITKSLAFVDFVKMNGGIKGVAKEMLNLRTNTDIASSSTGKMGGVLKGIGWTALIGLAFELGTELYRIASGAAQAEEDMARLEKTTGNALSNTEKNIKTIKGVLSNKLEQIDLKVTDGSLKDEKEILRLKNEAIATAKIELRNNIASVRERKDKYLALKKEAELLAKIQFAESKGDAFKVLKSNEQLKAEKRILEIQNELKLKKSTNIFGAEQTISAGDLIGQLSANINATSKSIELYKNELEDVNIDLNRNIAKTKGASKETDNFSESTKGATKETKALNTELKEQNEYLSKQVELLEELDEINRIEAETNIQSEIDSEFNNLRKIAEETGQLDIDLLEELLAKKNELQKKHIEERESYEISQIKERYRLEAELAKNELTNNRDELLSQDGLTPEAKLKIEQNYQTELAKLDMDNLQRIADMELEILIIKGNSKKKLLELDKNYADEVNNVNDELIEKQIEYTEKSNEINEENLDKEKKIALDKKGYIDAVTDYLQKNIDKRIELLNKEIEAQEKQYDTLQELANNGNIQASQSLAESAELKRQAEEEKAKLEKRKQQLQIMASFLTSYNNHLEGGAPAGEAFTKALTEKATLEALLASIPAFLEGTENTGKVSNPLDSNGGRLAILHDEERVLTKEQNKAIGNKSNAEVVAMIQKSELSEKMGDFTNTGWKDLAIINELNGLKSEMKAVKKAIEDKPETNYNVESVVNGIMTLNKTTKKGNNLIYNRFKIG